MLKGNFLSFESSNFYKGFFGIKSIFLHKIKAILSLIKLSPRLQSFRNDVIRKYFF